MTHVRPADLPELRYEIINWLHSETAHLIWRNAVKSGEAAAFKGPDAMTVPRDDAEINEAASALRGMEIVKLEQAELFYVSPDMVDLAVTASRTLPEFDLAPEDLPSRAGLMVFGKCPDPWTGTTSGDLGGLHAVSWGPHPARTGKSVVLATYYDRSEAAPVINDRTERRDALREPALIYAHGYDFCWLYGSGHPVEGDWGVFQATVRSAWLLMQQKLARAVEVLPDRAARRRAQREGRQPARLRIIELRRPESCPPAGMSEREYHHQWIVRGHWRQQACGPEHSRRRPTWIAPHIKGPEGTPMLGGEKVYAWKR